MIRNKRTGFGLQAVLASLLVAVIFLGGCTTTQNEKVYHVGVLSGLSFVADITDGLKAKMTELGYTEGKNIVYDVQKMDFDMVAYRSALNKFVDDKVDVIVVFPTEASMEAKKATEGTGTPVVFTFALIEGMGLVDSIREPGGNITGVRYPGPDIVLKRFEIMHEMVPQAKRFLVPYQRGYPIVDPQLEALRPAAEAAGITLVELPASNATELQAYLDPRNKSADAGFDAILIIVEPLAVTPDAFGALGKFAYEHKLPIGGALMAAGDYKSIFGVNVNDIAVGRQTAPLVDKVLRGTPAGTIPVVSADSYFQINYKAAQAFGLNVSEGLLARADEIIR
ncbi:MAG: ABC transporter substrate-binding protein [Candidatus Aenigmarchaeota archaeon]|jgi:putative ABC transport system substrate-binding protein|nr:ABC transporter substrate-binding protein [Candidatus Aenigmarchaeota archaeon]